MNLFKLLGQMPASNSPQFNVNSLDFKKVGRELLLMLGPTAITLITEMEGYRYNIHGTDCTVFVILGLRIALEVIRRFVSGSPQNPTS